MFLYLKKSHISGKLTEGKSVDSLMEDLPDDEKIYKPFKSEAQRAKFYAMAKEGKISQKVVEEWEAHTPKNKKLPKRKKKMNKATLEAIDLLKSVNDKLKNIPKIEVEVELEPKDKEDEVEKGLPAAVAASFAKTYHLHNHAAGIAQPQPAVGVNATVNEFEPTAVVPVRQVPTPFAMTPLQDPTSVTKSCSSCGCVHSAVRDCPKCSFSRAITEAKPLRFRGF